MSFKIKDNVDLTKDLIKYGFKYLFINGCVLWNGHPSNDASFIEIDLKTREIYIGEYENDAYKVNILLRMALDGLIEECN